MVWGLGLWGLGFRDGKESGVKWETLRPFQGGYWNGKSIEQIKLR